MAKQILNIPAGYEASFTTDALTTGTYLQYDEAHTGYSPISLSANTNYTIGPFNDVTNFQFDTVGNTQINFNTTFSGFYTAADEAAAGGAPAESAVTFTDITTNNASTSKHGYLKKLDGTATHYMGGDGNWTTPAGVVTSDATLTTTDITTNDVSTTKHGFAPKAPNDATKYLDGTGAYSVPAVTTDATLTTTDVTTNNATTSKHGFLKKLNGDNTTFLDGTGAFSTPAGGGGGGGSSLVCSVYLNADTSIAGDVFTVPFETVRSDTTSSFDIATNHRFQPLTAGLYYISSKLQLKGIDGAALVALYILKNGTIIELKQEQTAFTTSSVSYCPEIFTVVSMNGSTDYLTINVSVGVGASGKTITGLYAGYPVTSFAAFKIG